ncbi:13862_t:CDS:2, partial [Acaulospora colombiana]
GRLVLEIQLDGGVLKSRKSGAPQHTINPLCQHTRAAMCIAILNIRVMSA